MLLSLALLLALSLAGCGGGGSNSGSVSPAPVTAPAAPVTAPAAPLSVSSTLSDGLTATLAEDKAAVPVGGSVTYTLTLTNDTSQPITFAPYYVISAGLSAVFPVGGSLIVKSPAGATAYPTIPMGTTSSGGEVGPGPAATLAPGQSAAGTVASVAVFPAPGTYAASATFSLLAGPANALQSTAVGPLTVIAQ